MSNKEQLKNQTNTIEDVKGRLERIGNDIKSQSEEINIMVQWLDEVQGNLENLTEVIPDKFINNALTKIYTKNNQDKMEFLSSMLMITQDIFNKWTENYNYNFMITFHYERIYK